MWNNPEGGKLDPAEGVHMRCKKIFASPFRPSIQLMEVTTLRRLFDCAVELFDSYKRYYFLIQITKANFK